MRPRFQERPSFSAFAFILLLLLGCGACANSAQGGRGLTGDGREAPVNEQFKLSRGETVYIKDTALSVQLKSVRRTWYVDGKSETAEADVIITLDSKEQRQWMDIGEKVTVGDYVVELRAADPFGKTSCELTVTRR